MAQRIMTIRNNYCATCEEISEDHVAICSVCGERLGPPPTTTRPGGSSHHRLQSSRGSASTAATNNPTVRVVPEFLTDDLREVARGIFSDLGQIAALGSNDDRQGTAGVGAGEWQQIPAHILEPSQQSHSRPTSKTVLEKLPRIVLQESSSLFHQATIDLTISSDQESSTAERRRRTIQFQAIRGEFGPSPQSNETMNLEHQSIIVASPKTGKGRSLSQETLNEISNSNEGVICYMERGDGVTFVQKALLAQAAGASAVVIGNNMAAPWPYIMKDSKKEAEAGGLEIPVVMVKLDDGKKIVQACQKEDGSSLKCSLTIQSLSKDCVVCCDTFQVSDTVLQMPSCGHVFHETCALTWLTKQNTCPFCRRELPTDDQEYENERRRTQRTHAGSTVGNTTGYEAFYG